MALDPVSQQVQQDMAGGQQVNQMVNRGVQNFNNRNVPQRFTGRFSDAFNKARGMGAQTFNWNGKLYSTKVAGPQQPEMTRSAYEPPMQQSAYTPPNNTPARPAPVAPQQPQWRDQPQYQPQVPYNKAGILRDAAVALEESRQQDYEIAKTDADIAERAQRSQYVPPYNTPARPKVIAPDPAQWGGQPQYQPQPAPQQQAPVAQKAPVKPVAQEQRSAYTPPNNTPKRPAAIAPKPAQWGNTRQYQPQQAPPRRVKPKAEPELQHSAYRPPLQKSAYRPPSLVGNMMNKAPKFKPAGFKA